MDLRCFGRPFDDHSQDRVRLEADAVSRLLELATAGSLRFVASEALDMELSRCPFPIKRRRIERVLRAAAEWIELTDAVIDRAAQLQAGGLGAFDALHVPSALVAGVDCLMTVDDRLLRKASTLLFEERICFYNPLGYILETEE